MRGEGGKNRVVKIILNLMGHALMSQVCVT